MSNHCEELKGLIKLPNSFTVILGAQAVKSSVHDT